MTQKTRIIVDYCKGKLLIEELEDNIKIELIEKNIINERGEFTEEGLALKQAVIEHFR